MFYKHGFGFGPRFERFFHKGDFKYLILDLLKEKPRYGYEIIRALEERFYSFYTPSAGIVYPTLQMLEEMGYVTSSQQNGKKVYTITKEGLSFLAEREQIVEDIMSRMKKWCDSDIRGELYETMHELRSIGRLVGRQACWADPEKRRKIRKVISGTYTEIETILRQK